MNSSTSSRFDVVVVGGGPAGLSAALMLGRCRRRVLVCDAGPKRNDGVDRMWGFLSRDGIAPGEILATAREQLAAYPGVTVWQGVEVTDIRPAGGAPTGFHVNLHDGKTIECRKVLLATGVVDDLPPLEGIAPLYGKSVHHCPYCHAWEVRDQPLAVYGNGSSAANLALELTFWSDRVTLCTHGPAELDDRHRERLGRNGVSVREEPILRLVGTPEGGLRCVVFASGEPLDARTLFFASNWRQRSDLAARLGCPLTDKGNYETQSYEATCIPGIYVAGDASPTVQFAIVAAAEGAQAAFAINTALIKEDLAAYDAAVPVSPAEATPPR